MRNLLADQHTIEEEMEAAAVTAAAMMQWLNPSTIGNPWRLQQREMMRKIEQLNRQMYRKGGRGVNWGLLTGIGTNNFVLGPPSIPGQILNNQSSLVSRGIISNVTSNGASYNNRLPIEASGDSAEICGLQLLSGEPDNLDVHENIELDPKIEYKIDREDDKSTRQLESGMVEKNNNLETVKNDWINQERLSDLKPEWDEPFSSV